jgi:arginase
MNNLGLIGVPSSAGAHYAGQEKAPQALRRAGLVTGLARRGVTLTDFGDLPLALYQPRSQDRKAQNLSAVVEVARSVAERVDAALRQGLTPLVIGGDCTISLGALSGLLRHTEHPGLLYFDGDVDLSTPETSASGILDSMGIAHMLGEGAEALSHIGPQYPLVSADRLALFGFHPSEVSERDWEILKKRQILHFPVTTFQGQHVRMAQQAIHQLEQRTEVVLVHFDVDAIDSADCPLGNFPHQNTGLPLCEALECLRIFCASPKCGGLVMTELNPDHDGDGTLVPTFTQLLVDALH